VFKLFSTETQTETDFDLLKKPRLTNSPPSDVDDDPLFSAISRTQVKRVTFSTIPWVIASISLKTIFVIYLNQTEAETQFDLDDILCSNYTQTGDNYGVKSFSYD